MSREIESATRVKLSIGELAALAVAGAALIGGLIDIRVQLATLRVELNTLAAKVDKLGAPFDRRVASPLLHEDADVAAVHGTRTTHRPERN